jgi:hypothetical protein
MKNHAPCGLGEEIEHLKERSNHDVPVIILPLEKICLFYRIILSRKKLIGMLCVENAVLEHQAFIIETCAINFVMR